MVLQSPLIGMKALPFLPHPWEKLAAARAFPKEVNALWYKSQVRIYEDLQKEAMDCYRITYPGPAGEVTGLAALPKFTNDHSRLPLVIFNRGGSGEFGKLTAYNVVFPFADLVKAGYAVLASNYRGNDGGAGQDAFGGADVEDVLALIALGKKQPWWNGRIYLLGWSRGGMMTYLALKAGAQVNAAATLAGVAEMEFARFARMMPQAQENEVREALLARSALEWPETLSTPLLLMHGDADSTVHVGHSRKLAEQLNALSYEHRLVIYPAGTHSLSRYHKEIAAELLAWFGAH